jgi:hypothetical protein
MSIISPLYSKLRAPCAARFSWVERDSRAEKLLLPKIWAAAPSPMPPADRTS